MLFVLSDVLLEFIQWGFVNRIVLSFAFLTHLVISLFLFYHSSHVGIPFILLVFLDGKSPNGVEARTCLALSAMSIRISASRSA